jgi:hypothetical protein
MSERPLKTITTRMQRTENYANIRADIESVKIFTDITLVFVFIAEKFFQLTWL